MASGHRESIGSYETPECEFHDNFQDMNASVAVALGLARGTLTFRVAERHELAPQAMMGASRAGFWRC
jgi:hypothetical protein